MPDGSPPHRRGGDPRFPASARRRLRRVPRTLASCMAAPLSSTPQVPNRLAKATSPYLLQHRFNPVDWHEWGPEAFEAARTRNVPIFLSVGYSTCYWCHVMERESFENADIGELMSKHFVCIKVDREERPDVDEVYMAAVQAFTERGGWPMSLFLEPETLKPFWAGTYFPATAKFAGMPTFPQVLGAMHAAWTQQRDDVLSQARELGDAVRERVAETLAPVRLGQEQIARGVQQLVRLHDRVYGGFGSAPKFPQPVFLDLLLAVRAAAGDDQTRAAVDQALNTTLTRMAEGGVFDQVGGGFHRYSVDEKWLVPHFEKMLYDNGALAATYADAYAVFQDPLYDRTARRICNYVLSEMTSPQGGFFAAQDAEVNHREGQNYLWSADQIDAALAQAHAQRARDQAEIHAWLAGFDGLLSPTCPIAAPPLDSIDETTSPLSRLTRAANYLDLPAISVPCGLTPEGLPAGLQITGRPRDEVGVVALGQAFERVSGWDGRSPDLSGFATRP